MTEPRDDLLERYAEAAAQDPRKPSDRVRNAARAHAQMLRDQAAVVQRAENTTLAKPAANQPQWTLSLVASLAVVGLAGLMYLQIDRGTPEDREIAMGTPAPSPALSASPAPAAPAAMVETRQQQQPADKAVAAAPPSAKPAALAARKEVSPSPIDRPLKDSAQTTTANVATATRAYSAPPAEVDAAPRAASKTAEQLARAEAGAGADAKREASDESSGRVAPSLRSAAPMAPAVTAAAAPAAAAPAVAAPPPPSAPVQRRVRDTTTGTAALQFLEAARTGDTPSLQTLLAYGVAINTRDDSGNTALMLAVRHRHAAVVRKLLDMGADTALRNHEGLTALHIANQMGFADMAQLLQAPR